MKIQFLMHLIRDQRGTSAVEMGLICALIVMAMFTALQSFANTSRDMWTNVQSRVSASNQAASGG
jgi:Flp pilus assembly pilin Flp